MKITKNNENRAILPEPTIRRLPWYLSYVRMLDHLHVEYVSSTQISKELNVQSSQIAKDLSLLNVKGKTRIGYEVSSLVAELEDFLGFNRQHDAVVIGVGSLGTALMQDRGLEHYGLNIVAGFDVRPEVIGQNLGGLPVFDINNLLSWQRDHHVSIAIITVPVDQAQDAADRARNGEGPTLIEAVVPATGPSLGPSKRYGKPLPPLSSQRSSAYQIPCSRGTLQAS